MRIKLLATLLVAVFTAAGVQASWIGLWYFDDANDLGKATTGPDLSVGNTNETVAGINGPNDSNAVRVGVGDYLDPGGSGVLNEYSLVMDVMAPSLRTGDNVDITDQWRVLFTTGDDGASGVFVRGDDQRVGHGNLPGSGYTSNGLVHDDWYRVVFYGYSNPGNQAEMRITIIDSGGDLVETARFAGTEVDDQGHALRGTVRFSWETHAQAFVNNEELHFAGIGLYDGILDQQTAETLGAPGTVIPEPSTALLLFGAFGIGILRFMRMRR